MPYAALSPLDYPSDTITIRCDRTGGYRRATIIERFRADIGMPEVLARITQCPRRERISGEGCRAVFVELRERCQAVSDKPI